MQLKLSTALGYATLKGLEEDMVMEDFQDMLEAHSGIAPEDQDVLVGEPPRSLKITRATGRKSIEQMEIQDGDVITVRPRNGGPAPSMIGLSTRRSMSRNSMSKSASFAKKGSFVKLANASQGAMGDDGLTDDMDNATLDDRDPMFNDNTFSPRASRSSFTGMPRAVSKGDVLAQEHAHAKQDNPHSMPDSADMSSEHANMGQSVYIARRKMPDDNSCLFTAVAYVMEGFRSKGPELRQVIAETVLADTATYNEAFLGKSPKEYAAWIKDSSKWGGAIELSILSQHYQREIAAYDVKTQRCDVYGEDKHYREQVMLIYDGLHYDALSIAAFQDAPEEIDVSVFDPTGPQGPPAAAGARELVSKAHKDKQYTDTNAFALRCQICQIGVVGESEALEHAKSTGHANFSEYSSVATPSQPPAFAPAVGRVNA